MNGVYLVSYFSSNCFKTKGVSAWSPSFQHTQAQLFKHLKNRDKQTREAPLREHIDEKSFLEGFYSHLQQKETKKLKRSMIMIMIRYGYLKKVSNSCVAIISN